jgi:DNA-directed RNA polymerase specialized sigma24 family protein
MRRSASSARLPEIQPTLDRRAGRHVSGGDNLRCLLLIIVRNSVLDWLKGHSARGSSPSKTGRLILTGPAHSCPEALLLNRCQYRNTRHLAAQLPAEYRELLIQHAPNQAQQDLAGPGPTRSRRLAQ